MKKIDRKNFGLIVAAIVWIAAVILHNLWYAIFGFEEVIFFSIAVFLVPLYVIISIIYIIKKKSRKNDKNR